MYDVAKLILIITITSVVLRSCVIQFNNAYKWLALCLYISRWGKACDSVLYSN